MTTAPNTERDRFYQLRDARTVAYIERNGPPVLAPVAVHADDDTCATQAGQLTLLTLVNQLMRFHRVVRMFTSNPDVALLTPPVRGGVTLRDELVSLAAAIDPYSQFDLHTRLETYPAAVSIGLGKNCRADLDWYLGCDRSVGELGNSPSSLGQGSSSDLRGAGVAAVLGASAAMKGVLGMPVVPRKLSAWNFEEGDAADPGPAALPSVDVGRTLMVGAGAVAASVVYWLMQWGNCGPWTVADADLVALHNTNRCVLFFPADAGWRTGPARYKSHCLAQYLSNIRTVDEWYDKATEAQTDIFDTVLVLANERDVRTLVSHRNNPIQFQATTSPLWRAQLHRHIVRVDDCPSCRMSEVRAPTLKCSEASIATKDNPHLSDAALPFLSVASGLMLVSALQHLQLGRFGTSEINCWGWDFKSTHLMAQSGIRRCDDACTIRLEPNALREVASATRWHHESWLQSALT